jgi:hypothetical protein
MTTIAQVIGGLQRDPSVVAGRALAAAFASQRQKTPFLRVPRRAARRCWDGVVVTAAVPMDTFIGELPAACLAPRGDVRQRGDPARAAAGARMTEDRDESMPTPPPVPDFVTLMAEIAQAHPTWTPETVREAAIAQRRRERQDP